MPLETFFGKNMDTLDCVFMNIRRKAMNHAGFAKTKVRKKFEKK